MKKVKLTDLVLQSFPGMTRDEVLGRILSGEVYVDGERIRDRDRLITRTLCVELRESRKYVSRGGLKLEPVWDSMNLSAAGKVFIDAGCSTGGFTDFLVQRGAERVYAVDVGYNQLDFSLRLNSRVTVMERTNVMALMSSDFDIPPHGALADLSFRSIKGASAHLLDLVQEEWILALVKPQFEWKNPDPEFQGVIENETVLFEILLELCRDLQDEANFVNRIVFSPLKGRKGNRETFLLLSREETLTMVQIEREIRRSLLK